MPRITILEALFLVTDQQAPADWRESFAAEELVLVDKVIEYRQTITDSADEGLDFVREMLGICISMHNISDTRNQRRRLQKAYEEALGYGCGQLVKDFARAMDVTL